jgi:hypothetical protein
MTNAVNIAQSGSNNQTMRNRIINGAMVIDQRRSGASFTVPQFGGYSLDRWNTNATQGSRFSVQQDAGAVTPPAGFTDYLGVTSLSAYSVLSTDFFSVLQSIEGFNVADLAWGTANAQPVTVSFWVRSSLTGTFGGSLNNGGFNRAYPFTYTIFAANTWEYKTITVAGDTTGTWATGNTTGIHLYFNLGAGSNFSGTAGAWASSGAVSATGATSVVGTNGATFYITGVQLEEGTAASPFENRLIGTELSLCQRYCFNGNAATQTSKIIGVGQCYSTTDALICVSLPTTMRALPTLTYDTNLAIWNSLGASTTTTAISVNGAANYSTLRLNVTTTGGLVAGNVGVLNSGNSGPGVFILSAEL